MPLLGLYVVAIGGTAGDVGLAVSGMAFTSVATRLASGGMIDRYGRRRFLLGGAAAFLVVTVLYHFAVVVPLVIGVRLLQGVAFASFSTAAFALVADLVPPARRGEGIGVYTMATNVAQATAPAAALALLGAAGFGAVFGAINAAAALALVLMLFVRVPRPKSLRLTARPSFRLSALVSGSRRTNVYNFPAGVSPAMTDKWSRVNFLSTTGVCPRGPYVRTAPRTRRQICQYRPAIHNGTGPI